MFNTASFPVNYVQKTPGFGWRVVRGCLRGQFRGTQNTRNRIFHLVCQISDKFFQNLRPFLQARGKLVEGK